MPYFSNEFNPQPPASFTLSSFRGINRALPEEALYRQNGCYTHKGKNFWIDNGVLTVRNNYTKLFAEPITVVEGTHPNEVTYICEVKSAHIFCSKADNATPLWVLGCDMQLEDGETLTHHHYALVYGALDGSNWAECKTAKGSVFGEGKDLYFSNADFSFVNFTGNYSGPYTDDSVTVCTNGVDAPVAFLPGAGLYEVWWPGWKDATVMQGTGNKCVLIGLDSDNAEETMAVANYRVQLMSRTNEMPEGLNDETIYYVHTVSGSKPNRTFTIKATPTGSEITITDIGKNVMARLLGRDFVACTVDVKNGRIKVEKKLLPGIKKEHRLEFYNATPENYPLEIAPDTIYYIKELKSDSTYYYIKITDSSKNKAYSLSEPELGELSGLTVRKVAVSAEDCPRGELVFEHDQRLWIKIGNTLYYSDNFYKTQDWEYAHSRDWLNEVPELRTGSISILTFDGDTIKSAHRYGPENIVHKENSFWRIINRVPPYGVECVFSVKGTIAPRSVCQWKGNLIYAVAEGIQIYNGASSGHLLSDEIKGIWSPDNEGCICAVVGDTLYVYANLFDPMGDDADDKPALLVFDLPTKNVSYWTLDIDGTVLPEINAVLDPVFTTLLGNTGEQLFVFASGNQMYRVETAAPGAGRAADMVYYLPQNTFGDILHRKTLGRMCVYGSAPMSGDPPEPGVLVYTPIVGTTEKTARDIALPENPDASRPVHLNLSNVMSAGAKLENKEGSVPRIHSIQTELSM